MDISSWRRRVRGPFRADQLPDGSAYELTNGHPLTATPSTPERAASALRIAGILISDPGVGWVGMRAGYAPDTLTLRCPDVVAESQGTALSPLAQQHRLKLSAALMLASDPDVAWASLADAPSLEPSLARAFGGTSTAPDWLDVAPPLAIEIVEEGRDEGDLGQKVEELLRAGTRHFWAVRLTGPRRVEVYTATAFSPKTFSRGRELTTGGILRFGVPVEAFFDQAAADGHVLRNHLRRQDEMPRRSV